MRPLFMEFPDDEDCYFIEDEYLFGRDILFASITEMGVTGRDVYLPEGRWVNVNNRTAAEGGGTVYATAELHQFIAFVREGAQVLEVF